MIPDSEIPKCPEFEVKSKTGKIFKKHNLIEEYSVRIYEIDPYFYEHYENKIKLIKMGANIFYLDLIFVLINFDQQQKLRKKDKKHQKKDLVVNLLELIQVMQKMVRIQTMRLVMQKHLFMSLKTGNQKKKLEKEKLKKKSNKKIKELENKIKEKEEESNKKIKELEAKNKNSTTNQITNNFGKIIIKN